MENKIFSLNSKQKIAISLSPILFFVMFGVYQGFAGILGSNLGWYAGFAVYWPIFCLIIPLLLVGSDQIIERYKIIKINPKYLLVYLFPVFMTLIGGLFMSTAERDLIGLIIWLGMSVGNGVFEEILWRGVYPTLFPKSKLLTPPIIENNVVIGGCSIILPNIKINTNSVIAAGSIVTKDVISGTVVKGTHAKKMMTKNEYQKKLPQVIHNV